MNLTVLSDTLNIRQSPTTYAHIVGVLKRGEQAAVFGLKNNPRGVVAWADIGSGWVAIRYKSQLAMLDCDAPLPDLRYPVEDYERGWYDATGYMRYYALGYHTGADLNCRWPRWDADAHAPVFAVADGFVAHSSNAWNGLIIIQHVPLTIGDTQVPVVSRYGHVENWLVNAGDVVLKGEHIANIGRYLGSNGLPGNYHLHFDIGFTEAMLEKPTHWPGSKWEQCALNYVDPLRTIAGGL